MSESCGTCHYFRDALECRRYPPVRAEEVHKDAKGWITHTEVVGYWPEVRPDHWCGEWKPRAV